MSEKIELELKLKGGDKAVKTLGQLEKELNDAREAIKEVEVGSDAFKELATKIQTASSEVKTLEKQMEGLEPQQKAEAFLKMGEGIAGGFAMAQGAMGLMGVESEDLEKIQVKVQSAIAIAQGARMMSEAALMATTAKRIVVEKLAIVQSKIGILVSKGQAIATGIWATVQAVLTGAIAASTVALGALKIAIMATGIGALVIGVVGLVGAMGSWFSSSEKQEKSTRSATRAQKEQTEALQNHNKAIINSAKTVQSKMDAEYRLLDAVTEADKELERRQQFLEKEVELMNEAIATNEKNNQLIDEAKKNDDYAEWFARNEKNIKAAAAQLEQWTEDVVVAKTAVREQTSVLKEQEKTLKANSDAQSKRDNKRKERADKRKSEAAELFKLEQELSLMRIEDEDERNKAKLEQDKQNALEAVVGQEEQIKLIKEKYALLEAERLQAIEDAEFEKFIAKNDKWNEAQLKKQEERIAKETAAEEKAAAKQQELDAKVAEFKDGLGAQSFELARQLGGKNEKIQKGIAVAETIFNTQKAVMRAVADIPAPFGVVQAGIHGAMGVLAVNNILNENMGGVEGGATTEPMTPASTGAFSLGGAIEQEPIKTYVITDELTDSQAQLAEIRRRTIL
jgi:hypothetical protein